MLHILLLILKILLWILLGILGLVLLILLLILFAPVHYKVEASFYGKAKVEAKLRFLIFSAKILFDQKSKLFDSTIRVAGIKLGSKKKKAKTVKKEVEELCLDDIEPDDADCDDTSFYEGDTVSSDSRLEVSDDSKTEDNNEDKYETDDFLNEEFDLWDTEKCKQEIPPEERKMFGRIRAFLRKMYDRLKSLYNKLSQFSPDKISDKIDKKTADMKRKINRLKKFWCLSCTVKTRSYLKKYLVGLLKHVGPRKIKGHIKYGFDEPYKTGKYTGYLSLFPFVYQKGLTLEPDFYNKVFEGTICMKGHIQLGYILRIALNINIWRTIKVARKILGK